MPKFRIAVVGLTRVSTSFTVEARDKKEAEERAIKGINKRKLDWKYDDGVVTGVTATGITLLRGNK